jgi:radical SAM superfamily enzyme YgiQ (UPF0313 family)
MAMNCEELHEIEGLQFIPVNAMKQPIVKDWQNSTQKYDLSNCIAVGMVCGKPSGNVEVIDIDEKYSLDGKLFENYKRLIHEIDSSLLSKLVVQKTKNGGYHFIFRCSVIGGNSKLANRQTTDEEKADTYKKVYEGELLKGKDDTGAKEVAQKSKINDKVRVLIETRGIGGQIVCYPSVGYSLIHGDFYSINEITPEERDVLMGIARQFNEVMDLVIVPSKTDIKKVKGLGYKINKIPVLNTPEIIVPKNRMEIDLPGMAWDLLPDFNKYRTAGWHSWSNNTEQGPFAALYTSLGCPYKCSFCMINIINRTDNSPHIASADSNVYRWWSPDFIIKQFDYFAEKGIKNVKIADELFVLNPNHFQKICDLIIERGYDFNIWAYSRVDTCKPQYLDVLKEAGVNWLGLGIENPNQSLRQEIHKDHFVDVKITDLMQNMRDAGINIGGNYIFGLPMDTKESMEQTLEFAMNNKTEMVNFYCAMAYPGSPLHLTAKEKGWELPTTYAGYSQHAYETKNLPNENLTAAEILEFRDKAFITYNSHPEYLQLLENKFGYVARENMEETLKIDLKRQLLGD